MSDTSPTARVECRLPLLGQAEHEPLAHARGDVGVACRDRAVDVAHVFVHEHLLGAEVLYCHPVGVAMPVGCEALGDWWPAGAGPVAGRAASGRNAGPRLAVERHRPGLLGTTFGYQPETAGVNSHLYGASPATCSSPSTASATVCS